MGVVCWCYGAWGGGLEKHTKGPSPLVCDVANICASFLVNRFSIVIPGNGGAAGRQKGRLMMSCSAEM